MKKNKVKKFLICLFSFMFIASACITSGILLSGSSYSVPVSESSGEEIQDNENLTNVTANATEPLNDGNWTDSGNYDTTFAGGTGTESDPYLISTARQLAGLAYNVNNGTNYSGIYFEQTADINLSAYWWDAIGTYTSSSDYNEFAGHYNGGGYTVSGVFTQAGSDSNYSYQGLFGYVRGASSTDMAEISNVGVIDSNIQGYRYVAGIAGYAYYTNITNCYNTSSVSGSSLCVGGVVGYNRSSTVSNSYNTGSVTSSGQNVGGVVGYNYSSTVSNSYNTGSVTGSSSNVGGVVGGNDTSSVSNSYNTGLVTSSIYNVGGIVGQNSSSTVSNSYNTGDVTSTYTGTYGYVGGVAGYNSSSITNSYNTGDVTASSGCVGGVAGYNTGSATRVNNTYNTGSVSGTSHVGGVVGRNYNGADVYNSFNTGSVTGTSYIGAIVGYNYTNSPTVSNCYWGGNCALTSAGTNSGGTISKCSVFSSDSDPETESWYTTTSNWYSSYTWNFSSIWGISQYVNDGLPFLRGVGVGADLPTNYDSMWTDSGVTRDTTFAGSGTEDDPYLISSAEELAGLAYLTNISTSTTYNNNDVYYLQTADIDVSAYWWDAIGTSTSYTYYFRGHYDGGGYTVSGIYTPAGSDSTYSYQGLFGYVYGASSTNRAEISNVGVINSNIQGYQYVGGIAGQVYYADITNCYNTSLVTGSGMYVGGVVGFNSSSTVENSYNTGTVTGSDRYVGGVVGHNINTSTVTNSYNTGSVTGRDIYVAGVVGYSGSSSTVSNSYNTGEVTGTRYVGGVVGQNSSSTVSNSYNTGDVTSSSTLFAYTGGVAGYNSSTITNSYNTGSVTGSGDYVGGVVGYNYKTTARINNTYNTGNVSGTSFVAGIVGYNYDGADVYNSFNTGSVTGTSYIGAIVGRNYSNSPTVYNCYWGIDCTQTSAYGSNSGTVSNCEQFSSDSDPKTLSWYTSTSGTWNGTYPWDFTYVWALDSSVNDGYPIFKEISATYHSNFGDDETVEKSYYASSVDMLSSDTFTREHYEIASWNTNQTGTGTSYTPGETYQIATDINLYAQWQGVLYNITLNHGNGNTSTTIYQRYATGFYSDSGATTEITSVSVPTRAGYTFGGYYTGENGEGYQVIDEEGNIVVSNTFFTGNTTIYAYWTPNVPAYYDETGGYWYIEYGRMPQTKVTDNAVINALDGDSVLSDSDGVTTSNYVYYFAGMMLSAKVYQGEEYCNLDGNWYLVEPIRWRLDIESSTSGYVSTDTIAIMENVVYVGKYSDFSLSIGDGYVSANANSSSDIDYFLNNFLPNEKEYLTEFSASSDVFGTTNITTETSTNSIFLSSNAEISELFGTYESEFSDFVNDYLNMYGQNRYYFVRDLGSNLNNIDCHSQSGATGINQRSTEFLGMRFTIQVDEFVCL